MQDFTKPLAASNAAPTAKTKWLTKDRFWNFVFWFGMSFGMAVTLNVSTEQQAKYKLGTILIWVTLIGVPLLVRYFSKTSFVKKDTFTNSEGIILAKQQMPYSFPLAAISGLGIAFVVAEIILPKEYNNKFIESFVLSFCFFSGISLYFIFKNCPISILFNRKFWTFEFRTGSLTRHSEGSSSSRSSLNSNANPIHSIMVPKNWTTKMKK